MEEAALDVIGEAVRRTPAKAYVENYVRMLASTGRGPDGRKLAKRGSASSVGPTRPGKSRSANRRKRSEVRQTEIVHQHCPDSADPLSGLIFFAVDRQTDDLRA
jgi:hypothetical protein